MTVQFQPPRGQTGPRIFIVTLINRRLTWTHNQQILTGQVAKPPRFRSSSGSGVKIVMQLNNHLMTVEDSL